MESKADQKPKKYNTLKDISSSCIIEGSRKRNKKVVFDPSDNNLPKKRSKPGIKANQIKPNVTKQKTAQPDIATDNLIYDNYDTETEDDDLSCIGGVCSVCRQQKNDRLVSCRDCSNKAHLSCLNADDGMLRLRPDSTWQCPHCKTCVVCEETADSGLLTVCKICSDAYHSQCHSPNINDIVTASSKWTCLNCEPTNSDLDNMHISDTNFVSVENRPNKVEGTDMTADNFDHTKISKIKKRYYKSFDESDIKLDEVKIENSSFIEQQDLWKERDLIYSDDFGYPIDPLVPDARQWSSDDVYRYFVQFFPKEAILFKNEDIDGLALLLMTRNNVIEDLKLKMGTALRLYRHIVTLQERRDNPERYFL